MNILDVLGILDDSRGLSVGDRAWFQSIHQGYGGTGPCTVLEVRNGIYPYVVKLDVTGETLPVWAHELSKLAIA